MKEKNAQLKPDEFEQLFNLADVNRDKRLNKDEYVIFEFLVKKFKEVAIIPVYLPEVLVPKIVTFPNGDKYSGVFDRNGFYTGKGNYTFANGSCFEGTFSSGQYNGQGKFVEVSSGDVYTGEFKNDLFHGTGKLVYGNKDQYVGPFFEGKCHGIGKYTYANGSIYEGNFR